MNKDEKGELNRIKERIKRGQKAVEQTTDPNSICKKCNDLMISHWDDFSLHAVKRMVGGCKNCLDCDYKQRLIEYKQK